MSLHRISDADRRHRLGVRHGLSPAHRFADIEQAVRGLVAFLATDSPTVHLSGWARVDALTPQDVSTALEIDRTLVKQTAMRNTLFVAPTDLWPALLGSAADRVVGPQERRLVKAVRSAQITADPQAWVRDLGARVVTHLSANGPMSGPALRQAIAELDLRVNVAPGTRWGRPLPVAQYLLSVLCGRGEIVRAANDGPWRLARPTYATVADWFGTAPAPLPSDDGYAEITRRHLHAFGPVTTEDLVWWLGSTKTAAKRALDAVQAEPVLLDDGATAWVLPGDTGPVGAVEPWAALLPALDSTTMGWRGRDFHLDRADVPYLFDTVGNAGPTAWWDGRIVGCWVQEDDGVRVITRHSLPRHAHAALQAEAERLGAWLGEDRVTQTYAAKQARGEPLG